MQELIKVNFDSENPTVSGRDLYEALGIEAPYELWFQRMCEYGFTEGEDYTPYFFVHPQNSQETTEHQLTIPMAKAICTIQRNERGRRLRQYLITIENQLNTYEAVLSSALKLVEGQIKQLALQIFAQNF